MAERCSMRDAYARRTEVAALPVDEARAYTQRVQIGAFYTDGTHLGEVVKVNALGWIQLQCCRTGDPIGVGITRFRRDWWRVR